MANNRMFLVNKSTGQRVLIAKHLLGAWYVHDLAILDKTFDAEVHVHGADHGSTAWHVEYERDEPDLDRAIAARCGR